MVEAMEIQKGYKQTEVGVIPSDWKVNLLGNIGSFKKGKNIPKSMLQSNGVPCVLYGEIYTKYNSQCSRLTSRISIETAKNATEIKYGAILFAGSGETAEDIGKCFTYSGGEEAYAGGDVIVFTAKDSDPIFLGFLLNSVNVNKQKAFMGQGSSVFHIYSSNLKNLTIPLPPTKTEQTAIATALNDADALITQLVKLIAKKRAIKQGAMQDLLKPKEGWEVKKLGEVGEIVTGSTPPTQIKEYWNGTIPWITPTDIYNKKDIFHSEREITNKGLQIIRKIPQNSLLVTCIASIGKNAILRNDGACNQQINAIVQNGYYDIDFLYYLIEFSKNILIGRAGITATLILSKKEFSELEFYFPSLEEQTHIAQILSDMDAEIEALEKKLKKQKMIKQGMMQNLLTGRIRLV